MGLFQPHSLKPYIKMLDGDLRLKTYLTIKNLLGQVTTKQLTGHRYPMAGLTLLPMIFMAR
jgi:hypothetical protein